MSADHIPAFPCEWDYISSNRRIANGMTLRDYFAAKAMQSMVVLDHMGSGTIAKEAYEMADAMLKERGQ
jgi:hypothetical protein